MSTAWLLSAWLLSVWRSLSGPRGGPVPPPALEPPAADRVLRRALALAATSLRGQLEYEAAHRESYLKHLREAVLRHGLGRELEEEERSIIALPVGAPTPQQTTSASWRAEGLAVLSWALGIVELPAHDRIAERDHLVMMGWLLAEVLPPDAAAPKLRAASELEAMRKHLLGVHWRLRDFGIRPRAMDFAAFSRKCWFGSFDLMGVRLIDGDLAIGDAPIHRAAPEALSRANSIAVERHHAINWLCGEASLYADVETST